MTRVLRSEEFLAGPHDKPAHEKEELPPENIPEALPRASGQTTTQRHFFQCRNCCTREMGLALRDFPAIPRSEALYRTIAF